MNVLLLRSLEKNPQRQVKASSYAPSLYPPLGLEYIGASLEQSGHTVELRDLGYEKLSNEQLKDLLLKSDAVGVSVYTNSYQYAADLTCLIKEIDSDIPLIIGGPHCIFLQERSLNTIPHADIAVGGEGEKTVVDIMRYFEGKQSLSDIHGIHYRENGIIKSGKPLQAIDDLDCLAFPARHLTEKYEYGTLPWGCKVKKKFTFMMTSRGCPFRCRFCARYGNATTAYGFRLRSAENVVQEFLEIDKRYKSVAVVDDHFLADKKRANKIFDMLIAHGTSVDILIVGARIDSADRALYEKMKKAHVIFIGYGIESGNQDVLDFYDKKITTEQIRNTVNLANEMGFFTYGTFILGAPIETTKHFENTIHFAQSLPLDIALFGMLQYEMGSPLWSQAVEEKKVSQDEYMVPADSRRGLGNFTPQELSDYSKKAIRRYYIRPSYLLRQIGRSIKRKDSSMLLNGLKIITSM